MELYEKLDLEKIKYLSKMTFNDYKQYSSSSCKNEAERKIQYEIMKKFCQINIKAKGEVRRIYSYTLKTPIEVGGRLYCGNSIQGLNKYIRGFLCNGVMTDVDMKNAHPTIARYLCKKNNIDHPNLNYYIENRNLVCDRFQDGKTTFLKALNDDKLNKKITDKFFKSFDVECKNIQKAITTLPSYKHIVDTTPLDKSYNFNGSSFNRIMCVYENKILQEVITVLNSKQIEIGVLMFDGLMIYGDFYKNEQLLRDIERHINEKFEGLNMIFDYKPHDNTITMPDDYEDEEDDANKDDCYEKIKEEFEKTHCKIVSKAFFINETDDGVQFMNRTKIKDAYEHLKYVDYSGDEPKQKSFINTWLSDKNILKYDDVIVAPPPLILKKNTYNLWTPFTISKYKGDYIKNEEGLKMFKNHIKILCGNDENVADYIIKWFAQMFQYPAVKTIVPTFISEEGAGKGLLLEFITTLMGSSKLQVTTTPSRDVWGHFNSLMSNSFFVNLNEMCLKETADAEGKIKGLVTDPRLTINKKNQDPYDIISYHRFMITTNSTDPINTKKGDRRNIIIECSNEKVGDINYFTELYNSFNNIETQRTVYDYLMSVEGMDKFNEIKHPQTEYQEDMKEISRNKYDQFVEYIVNENRHEKELGLYGGILFDMFKNWISMCGIKYETSLIKLCIGIKRLKLDGIVKGNRDGVGIKTIFNIDLLKKYYGIVV